MTSQKESTLLAQYAPLHKNELFIESNKSTETTEFISINLDQEQNKSRPSKFDHVQPNLKPKAIFIRDHLYYMFCYFETSSVVVYYELKNTCKSG